MEGASERYPENHPGDLAEIIRSHRGRSFTKWFHYIEIYERHLHRFRGKAPHVLEIGVRDGGSLQLWRSYFGAGATISGVDIDPTARDLEREGFPIYIGDQADRNFLAHLKKEIPRLDVVVDDGGNHMQQLQATFEELYPHLSADGVYVCEDLHTCYMRAYGGAYQGQDSFVEKSKGWIDQLNACYSEDSTFQQGAFGRSTHSMHYYDSMLVIEKRPWAEPRVISFQDEALRVFLARPR